MSVETFVTACALALAWVLWLCLRKADREIDELRALGTRQFNRAIVRIQVSRDGVWLDMLNMTTEQIEAHAAYDGLDQEYGNVRVLISQVGKLEML